MIGTRKFSFRTQTLTVGGQLTIDTNCCEILVVNQGDDAAYINGLLLKPYPTGFPQLVGSSFAVDCNDDEEYDGYLELVFAGVGVAPLVQVVQRFYKLPDR